MLDPQAEWDHPHIVRIRDLESKAHRLANEIFNEIGPGEIADLAYNLRVGFTKALAPYRRGIGEQYRKLRTPDKAAVEDT